MSGRRSRTGALHRGLDPPTSPRCGHIFCSPRTFRSREPNNYGGHIMVMPGSEVRGPTHQIVQLPPLAEIATMVLAGEDLDLIAVAYARKPATLREKMRMSGWDPDTGHKLNDKNAAVRAGKTTDLVDFRLFEPTADTEWIASALCAQTDPELFFPTGGGPTSQAKKLCLSCEVRDQCLEYALDNNIQEGVWGARSVRERRALKKQRGSNPAVAAGREVA